jgi:hypothetical protein
MSAQHTAPALKAVVRRQRLTVKFMLLWPGFEERAIVRDAGHQRSAASRLLESRAMNEPTTPPSDAVPEAAAAPAPSLPDRLSVDPRSPFHAKELFAQDVTVGIRFNGKDRFDVEEYCISEGWIRVPVGRSMDRKGRSLTIKLKGQVEAFLR